MGPGPRRPSRGFSAHPEEAPFDRILVSAMARALPEELVAQLAEHGILVVPGRGAHAARRA